METNEIMKIAEKIYKHTGYGVRKICKEGFAIGCQYNTFDEWLKITESMSEYSTVFLTGSQYKKARKAITVKKFREFIVALRDFKPEMPKKGKQFVFGFMSALMDMTGLKVKWVSGDSHSNYLMEGHEFVFTSSNTVKSNTNHDDHCIVSFRHGHFTVAYRTVLEVL